MVVVGRLIKKKRKRNKYNTPQETYTDENVPEEYTELQADHRVAHGGDLDQGPVEVHAGLLGGVPAHQSLDPPAVRDLRQHGRREAAGEVEGLSAARR